MKTLKPKSRKAKSDKAKAKEAAWKSFSRYIRTRDCIRFSGSPDLGKCVTCNTARPYKELQAGHFIQGRGNAVLFDERIVYSQDSACNMNPPYGKGGNYVEYFIFMEEEWGRTMIDEFRELKSKTVIYKIPDLIAIKEKFDQKYEELMSAYNH